MLEDTTIKHRTVHRFADERMPPETLKELLVYASMTLSSANAHPVEFIVVSKKEDMGYLAAMDRFGAKHFADAPLTVLIIANKGVRKCWVQEAIITAAYLSLLIQEGDYQPGYLPSHDNTTDRNVDAEVYVRDYLSIPDNYGALGIPTIRKEGERIRTWEEFPIDEKVRENRF